MREVERRLEALLDRAGGQRWDRAAHASELAGSILRALDLSVEAHHAPNRIVIPEGIAGPEADILSQVAGIVQAAALERGWRLEGPVVIVPAPVRTVSTAVESGPLPAWAILEGDRDLEVTHNRSVIGRHSTSDIVITDPSVSRSHALLWHADGRVFVEDLASSNGTLVDGVGVGSQPVPVHDRAIVTVGRVARRVRILLDA